MNKSILIFGIFCFITFSCTKDEPFKPMPVELIRPKFGESHLPLDPVLEWKNPNTKDKVYSYEIFIGKSENDMEKVDSNITISWVNGNPTYQCNELEKNTKYFWKVRLKTCNGHSDSKISEFTTFDKLPSIKFHNSTIMIYPKDNNYLRSDSIFQYIRGELSGATNWTDGYLNTLALVKDYEKYNKEGMYMAAYFCNELNAYGYSDWYLPSIVELDSVNVHLELTKTSSNIYWSSNEYEKDANFGHVIQYLSPPSNLDSPYNIHNKYGHLKCRCIRRE